MNVGLIAKRKLISRLSINLYMGILLTSSLSWSSEHSKLVSQAQKDLFAIKAYQIAFGYFSAIDSFKIFDSIVKPILCYASQIWGYEYVDTIASVYNRFCKNYSLCT